MHLTLPPLVLVDMAAKQPSAYLVFDAEREGFEPPEPRSSTVFKTAAIDHSAISPSAKVLLFFLLPNF